MEKENANFSKESEIENQVENDDRESMFITCNVAQESSNKMWFLDSGCRKHMSGKKDMFSDIDHSITSQVKLGDNKTVAVTGKGQVNIITK